MAGKKKQFRFQQLGLVLFWFGIIALMFPGSGNMPSPSAILLPLGFIFFAIGWLRRER